MKKCGKCSGRGVVDYIVGGISHDVNRPPIAHHPDCKHCGGTGAEPKKSHRSKHTDKRKETS